MHYITHNKQTDKNNDETVTYKREEWLDQIHFLHYFRIFFFISCQILSLFNYKDSYSSKLYGVSCKLSSDLSVQMFLFFCTINKYVKQ